jgi:hypothetical protein
MNPMNPDLVIFSFSNESVRNLNFAPFLKVYGPQPLPGGARLKQMQGRLLIAVEGYDDKTGELYEFPEVRQFYRKFYEVFPYWLYFTSLETDCLKIMELSLLKSFTALKRDGFAQVQVVAGSSLRSFLFSHRQMPERMDCGNAFGGLLKPATRRTFPPATAVPARHAVPQLSQITSRRSCPS